MTPVTNGIVQWVELSLEMAQISTAQSVRDGLWFIADLVCVSG